jgi:hypothetical protein
MSSPQRFFANHRNLIAAAVLTPSAVQAVANSVVETPVARDGTARVELTGDYAGLDDATYEIEIVDETAATKLLSRPVFNGAGSETLSNLAVTTAAQQDFTLECAVAGTPALQAKVDVEGVKIIARLAGTAGNSIRITVDESGLTYAATAFSLLADLKKGSGSPTAPVEGPEFDWQTATVGADDVIPDAAQRLVFEGDESNVYVQYKRFAEGKWQYFFVPEILNDYPAGTRIKFVSGSRAVTITDGVTSDNLPNLVTVYDFLIAVKTTSTLCDVEGVVADDRTPTGQSARELNLHTNARHGYSYGTGSKAARGFANIDVTNDANTELIQAECIAVSFADHPLAHLGHEAWQLTGSVQGDLGIVFTGEPIVETGFSAVIPERLPPSIAQKKGRFTMTDVSYVGRVDPEIEPPICFYGALGPNAVDQTLTLVYTERPTGDCDCSDMPVPALGGPCLGEGSGGTSDVSYQDDTNARLAALREWYADAVRDRSSLPAAINDLSNMDPVLFGPPSVQETNTPAVFSAASKTLGEVVDDFERAAALMDPLAPASPAGYRENGFAAWDDAVTELQGDVDGLAFAIYNLPTERYRARLNQALATAGISPLGKSDASTVTSGDGCWRDIGDPFYWTVVGSDGAYAPAFNNTVYYSSRPAETNGRYFSTKEFAFILNIKCPEELKAGDTITLTIGNAGQGSTYQVGDMLFLPLIAAQDLYLTGGRAADKIQTWLLTGSVEGAFPVYSFDPDNPVAYSSNGIGFLLVMGGLDPAKGDRFTWSVVGGHYRWRKDGGAWSSDTPIPDGAAAFDSGLSIEFVRGVAPSFVALDAFTFRALQPWQADNLKRPNRTKWYPGTTAPTLRAVFEQTTTPATPQPITHAIIAYHSIPEGATIQLVGGDTVDVVEWTEPITWKATEIGQKLSQERTAVWCRLELANATGAAIGWFGVGVADSVSRTADASPKPAYRVDRGNAGGLYQGGTYLGRTTNLDIAWSDGALSEADIATLVAMLDHVKTNDDEPLLFIPNETRSDAWLAHVIDDEIQTPEMFGLQPDVDRARRYGARFSLQGVWR